MEIGGGYKLTRRLRSVGAYEVWRAEPPGGITVAVEILRVPSYPEEARSQLRGLELSKRLRHPFLLQTLAHWQMENRLVIILELAEDSLRDYLRVCKSKGLPGIPTTELLTYCQGVAEALDYLHGQGIQHFNINPDNILLVAGYAKLADFELRRTAVEATGGLGGRKPDQSPLHRDLPRGVVFSPLFTAPEIWRGQVSAHSDQYALAVTYAILRLNRRPWPTGGLNASLLAHLLCDEPDLSGMARKEQAVVLKALAKEPQQRFPKCQAFMHALERALR
jgi:serine/threonine-protein kinase